MKKHQQELLEIEEFTRLIRSNIIEITEIELLILKGHILVEYTLNNFIKKVAFNGHSFKETKFTFSQKMHFVETLSAITSNTIRLIEIFNKLRNQIAHKLKYDEETLKLFLDTSASFEIYDKKLLEQPLIVRVRAAISLMCTSINFGVVALKVLQDNILGIDLLYLNDKK